MTLLVSEFGPEHARRAEFGMGAVNPHRNADDARRRATLIRAEADELRSLPVNDAAQRIEVKRAEKEHTRQREGQLSKPFDHEPRRSKPKRDGPARGL